MAYTTIDNPELYFQAKLWTGTGSENAITLDGDTDLSPNFVAIKKRNAAVGYRVYDSVRGVQNSLYFDDAAAEATGQSTTLTAFNSDGFTVISESGVNASSDTYVAWCWKESATAGFDIVAYTGNGTDDTDISHNLSAVPKMIIVKNRDAADAWQVYHGVNTAEPETDYLVLNDTAATADNANRWSDEAPTSSVFTLGDADEVNTDTEDYIAYCFAEKQGFSKFGSYEGNGSTTATGGPFIYTGFSPSFVIIKDVDAVANWEMFDNKRIVAGYPAEMHPHANAAQSVPPGDRRLYFTSNGFKIDTSHAPPINASGETYIYLAFAEAPLVNSNGVPCNAR